MSICSFHQLFSNFQFDREWFTSHVFWKIEINEFATTSNARVFFAQFWHMQFQKQWSFHTNSHYVITQCDDFICLQNDRIRNFQNLHMFAKIFRANSRFSIHVFEFSKVFHFDSICRRCQEHFVIYLFSSWFTLIVSRIESSEIFMKISILKKCWFEKVTKIVCFFEFLINVSRKF